MSGDTQGSTSSSSSQSSDSTVVTDRKIRDILEDDTKGIEATSESSPEKKDERGLKVAETKKTEEDIKREEFPFCGCAPDSVLSKITQLYLTPIDKTWKYNMPFEYRYTRKYGGSFTWRTPLDTECMFVYSLFGRDDINLAGQNLTLNIPHRYMQDEYYRDSPRTMAFYRAVYSTMILDDIEDYEGKPHDYLPGGKLAIVTAEDICRVLRIFCSIRNISMSNIGDKYVTFYWSSKGHDYRYTPID